VVVLSLISLGLVTRAANLGGDISHPEIRFTQDLHEAEAAVPNDVKGLTTPAISQIVTNYRYVWPICEVVHFIGLALLMGVVLVINLRVLGVGTLKGMDYRDVHKLLPWGVAGFTFNAISGMVFFIAQPQTYTLNLSFDLKMLAFVLAGVTVLYQTMFDELWTLTKYGARVASREVHGRRADHALGWRAVFRPDDSVSDRRRGGRRFMRVVGGG
jgi:hypothetical protein